LAVDSVGEEAAAGVSDDRFIGDQTNGEERMTRATRIIGVRLLLALLLVGLAGTASAQQPTQAQASAIRSSCRSDYQSNCSGVPTGGMAALQCLQGHIANLSPPCQTAVNAVGDGGSARPPAQSSQSPPSYGASPAAPPGGMSMRQEAMLMRRSCGRDFRAYCQGVELGGGRALACLAANQTRLSPPCKGALAEAQGTR